ncbi:MAG: sigma 54-interacting transcriptional regulator [Flavobacteriales bacterium]|nr:sigma 54-interacting transcriptional regulator [Flavobacteriales bacterium]
MNKNKPSIKTFGELKAAGIKTRSVRDEMRENLIEKIKTEAPVFAGIHGYEDSVLPEVQHAILARHSMNLLGLRGQAKTRIARGMIDLLDEWIPIVKGSELNDDPYAPLSVFARNLVKEHGDETPITWMHRSERYVEKLATPDVTISDLIGDVDPIKAMNMKLDYADERVIHFGLIPRANRSIFVINELPDLQPRIQVALFNILQEGDIQIRGFQLRLPLDVAFVFTANPEDYTNRGAIITPLKDRIQSQILTHYPRSIEISGTITQQETRLTDEQRKAVVVPDLLSEMIERVAFEARESEFIDQKSGVSARLTISALENLVSTAELRMLQSKSAQTTARVSDMLGIIPAVAGKVELVYEGEQEGPRNVALHLLGKAIRTRFPQVFPNPETLKRKKQESPYDPIVDWFSTDHIELLASDDDQLYSDKLNSIGGLSELVDKYLPGTDNRELWMEFALHGLGEFNLLNKEVLDQAVSFSDLMDTIFSDDDED